MTEFPYQKFFNLVAFDQETHALERAVHKLETEINQFQNEVFKHEDMLEQDKITVASSKKRVDEKELEMKSLEEQIKNKQVQFDRVVNQREYQSIAQEIETLKKKQYDLEESLLEAWNILESQTQRYTKNKNELEKKIESLEQSIESAVVQKKELVQKIKDRQSERPQLQEGIPQEWLEKYSTMLRSVHNPVVPVVNNSCSACFYSITQQDLTRLKKHALLQCKECYRFLYME